jgi:hypothetical protein
VFVMEMDKRDHNYKCAVYGDLRIGHGEWRWKSNCSLEMKVNEIEE